jgi:hypothetical protein
VSADDFLSGESGHVAGIRAVTRNTLRDRVLDVRLALGSAGRAARSAESPPRRVLVAGIYGPRTERMRRAVDELRRTHHDLEIVLGAREATAPELSGLTAAEGLRGGKFENLNALLEPRAAAERDWLVVVDAPLPGPLPRDIRGARLRARAARPDLAQPRRLARHSPSRRRRRAPDPLRRDRARDRLPCRRAG